MAQGNAQATNCTREDSEMRDLTDAEIEEALSDNGEAEEGGKAVETTIKELADMKIGTCCGVVGNQCFVAVAAFGNGLFADNKVRGWLLPDDPDGEEDFESAFHGTQPEDTPCMMGMMHIEGTQEEAYVLEALISVHEGSARLEDSWGDGRPSSVWKGFWEYEIE